jgi:hypothetical protein
MALPLAKHPFYNGPYGPFDINCIKLPGRTGPELLFEAASLSAC